MAVGGMKEQVILGIDPSSKVIAAVAACGPGMNVVRYDICRKSTSYTPAVAMEAMTVMHDLVDGLDTYGVDSKVAWVEAPLIGRGGAKATMVQSFVSGVIQACLIEAGYDVHLVNVQSWKKTLCGNGHASKDDVGRFLAREWPKAAKVCGDDPDLIDAAAICLYGAATTARGSKLAIAGALSES